MGKDGVAKAAIKGYVLKALVTVVFRNMLANVSGLSRFKPTVLDIPLYEGEHSSSTSVKRKRKKC